MFMRTARRSAAPRCSCDKLGRFYKQSGRPFRGGRFFVNPFFRMVLRRGGDMDFPRFRTGAMGKACDFYNFFENKSSS